MPATADPPNVVETHGSKIAAHLDGALRLPRMLPIQEMGIPDRRLAKCERDYEERVHAWATMLESHARLTKKKK